LIAYDIPKLVKELNGTAYITNAMIYGPLVGPKIFTPAGEAVTKNAAWLKKVAN